jgi:hypothetical protein
MVARELSLCEHVMFIGSATLGSVETFGDDEQVSIS